MQNTRKKVTSLIAGFLAVLYLLPMQEAVAAEGEETLNEDSPVLWGTTLPGDEGNTDYDSDVGWHRIVFEYGDYCTNSVDSNGDYVDLLSHTATSWPADAWHNSKTLPVLVKRGSRTTLQPDNWPGDHESEWMSAGTLQRAEDHDIYANGEYSEDGMYSLWVKYAGTNRDKTEDCWYISPCDENGNRAKKLWALDCCVDATWEDPSEEPYNTTNMHCLIHAGDEYVTGSKPVMNGIDPKFTLLTPTFKEFEETDNFQYAGVAISYYYRDFYYLVDHSNHTWYGPGDYATTGDNGSWRWRDQLENNGMIRCKYEDNEKWIIKKNTDGSWVIKSAGYIDWDWSDPNGDFVKTFVNPADAMASGLATYVKACAYGMVGGNQERKDHDNEYGCIELCYLGPWSTPTWYAVRWARVFYHFAYMVFLSDYAENVYITASYLRGGTAGKFNEGDYYWNLSNGGLHASYGMRFGINVTKEQYDEWLNYDVQNTKDEWLWRYTRGWQYECNAGFHGADMLGIKVKKDETGSTGEVYSTYMTIDEIKKTLPIYVEPIWTPTKGEGAFDAVYVGDIPELETVQPGGGTLTVNEGETKVFGIADGTDEDTFCDGVAFLGTTVKQAIKAGTLSGGTYKKPNLTVEKGAKVTVEGPTFAAAGTTITVRGELEINPGAFLCGESLTSVVPEALRQGIHLIIDGGTVTVNNGAMLDVGFADVEIKNGGTLSNYGVFIQATDSQNGDTRRMAMQEGTVENGITGWVVIGADVYHYARMKMMSTVNDKTKLAELAKYISNVRDVSLGKFSNAKTVEEENLSSSLYLNGSGKTNIVMNTGNMLVTGAIKGKDALVDKMRSSGNLYRGLDIVKDSTVSVSGADFSNHTAICSKNKTMVTSDPVIKAYYDISRIDFGTSTYVGDDEATTIAGQRNLLALRVGTGSQGTSGIANFRITYEDTGKVERTQIVDTQSLAKTYELVSEASFCGKSQNEKGDSQLKTHKTGGVMSQDNMPTTLEPVSNVTYIFQTASPVSYIKSISFTGVGVGSWTCTELNVYRVKYLYPLQEYGWSSEDWYVPFEGELIAETALGVDASGVRNTTFVWDSNQVEIGTGLYQLNIYNAPEGVESKFTGTGFAYYKASQEQKLYSTQMDSYTFSAILADTMSAGIESLYNAGTDVTFNKILSDADWQKKYEQDVTLDLLLTYVDTRGSAHRVTLPFSQSAVEWAYANMNSTSRAESIHGLFQQGEEIAFRAPLPDFSHLVDVILVYNDPTDGADIAVASVTINKTSYTTVMVEDGVLSYGAPESALYYYCAPDTKGTQLDAGRTMDLKMKEWTGKESLMPSDKGTKYLVIVETDSMAAAGTTKDLYVSFTYDTVTGSNYVTPRYGLRNMVNNYYGYWLNSAGEDVDCGYLAAVSPGGQMYFVLNLSNVYKFTSATFYMPKTGETVSTTGIVTETPTEPDTPIDIVAYTPAEGNVTEGGQYTEAGATEVTEEENEFATLESWQMKAITVYELDELGARKVVLGSGINLSGVTTNRTYYRENIFSTRGAISRMRSAVLITPGKSKTVTFDGTVSGGGMEGSKNQATDVKELSYEDTKRDYGFNTRRVKYSVGVQVDGTSVTSAEDGDCGSKNQFYFQLVFQDDEGRLRTSPCVLANQQLNSDGFRTGALETFNIYTNDDYGTPVQINIIPDDTASTSDVFDKLCVKHITVSRTSGTGVNLSWKTGSVGWIDIDYTDDAEDVTGRTNEELIRSFQLHDNGYSVWLEFAIETDSTYYNSKQFVGQVLADIVYRDTSGALVSKENIGVVAQIADYAERKSELADATEKGTEVSMPSFMFRKGYTNRFLLDFDDISSLVSIKFKISSTEPNSGWTINNVSVRQVYDEGTLRMNIFNEYEHMYSVEPQDLTSTSNAKPLTISATGSKNTGTLNFTSGNTITINLAEGEEEIEVETAESEGANDRISMTVELDDSTGLTAGVTMTGRVVYKNIYGDACEVPVSLVFDGESQKFMIPMNDLPKTADIGVPYQVELIGGAAAGRKLTAVKINQLRDSGVEETFLFVPEAPMPLQQTELTTLVLSESEQDAYAARKGYTHENQEVYMKLGTLTERILLTETQDLQLALIYTEKDDPYAYEHTSDYVSVLDNGYTVLKSGDVVWVPMNVNNIGSVKAVNFKTSSTSMKINIDKACIFLQETSNMSGTMLSYGWVNLPAATGLIQTETGTNMNSDGSSLQNALKSATRITPIGVEANLTTIARSDAVMKVTVTYLNAAEELCAQTFEKSASDWNKEGTWALIDGVSGVVYYKVEVYDTDPANTASVTVGNIDISWFNTDGEYTTASINDSTVINEGTVVTNALLNSSITGTVTASNGATINLADNVVSEGRTEYQSVTVNGGETVQISARLPGFSGELELSGNVRLVGFNGDVGSFQTVSANANSDTLTYAFSTQISDYQDNLIYDFTVRSKNFPDNYAVKFSVVVKPTPYLEVYVPSAESTANPTSEKVTGISRGYYGVKGWNTDSDTVVTFYARAEHYPNGLGYQLQTNLTQYCGVQVTEGVYVEGFAGTWTQYDVHFNKKITTMSGGTGGQVAFVSVYLKGQESKVVYGLSISGVRIYPVFF